MKLTPFIVLAIMLFSCTGNGNKSEKNQKIMDMDSESVAIDTMETSTIESEEKAEKPTRVKTKDSIVGLYYCKKVATHMFSMTIIVDYFFLNQEIVALLIGTKQVIQLLLLLLGKWSS